MKKILKIVGICFISIIVVFIAYIGIELYRFDNKLGCRPLFQIKSNEINISSDKSLKKDRYYSLLFSFEYEYILEEKESSDIQTTKIYKGEMFFFNNIPLKKWIKD